VGSGRHGSRYAEVLASQSIGARLTALCRRSPEQLKASAERFQTPKAYTDYEALLADEEIDAVVIATPNHLHADMAVKALKAGKHVLVEKPMAVSVKEAEAVVKAVESSRLRLMVAHNFRYHPVYREAKSLLELLGRPYLLMACKRQEPASGWRVSKSLAGGGTLLDLGVHLFDTALWLTGFRPQRAYASLTYSRTLEVEDGFTALLEGDGMTAVVDAFQISRARFERLELSGEEGHLAADRYRSEVQLITGEGRKQMAVTEPDESLKLMLMDFVKAVKEDAEPPITARDGLMAVKIAESCYRSAQLGAPEAIR